MPVPSAPRSGADYSGFPGSTIRRQLHKRAGCSHSWVYLSRKSARGWTADYLLSRSLLCVNNQRPEVSEILLDLGPSRLRRTAEDSQSLSRSDKVSQRPGPHLLRDVTAMNLDGFFGCAQLMGDLLVEHTRYDVRHHFTVACRKRVISPAQVFEPRPLHSGCTIEINRPVYSVQKILLAERL